MIEQDQPYALEFQNFRRVHRNRAIGELFAIELEITEDDWHHLSDFPQDAIGELILRWTERAGMPEKVKRESKPAKEPSPYGKFWQAMDKAGFHNRHDVRTWLDAHDLMEAPAKERMREVWGLESRTTVSPESVIAWLLTMPNSASAIAFVENIKTRGNL